LISLASAAQGVPHFSRPLREVGIWKRRPLKPAFGPSGNVQTPSTLSSRPEQIIAKAMIRGVEGPDVFWVEERAEIEAKWTIRKDDADAEEQDQADAAAGNDVPATAEVKPVSIEEARMQVKGVIRDWFLTTVCQKPQ
jgi:hypothetical protein